MVLLVFKHAYKLIHYKWLCPSTCPHSNLIHSCSKSGLIYPPLHLCNPMYFWNNASYPATEADRSCCSRVKNNVIWSRVKAARHRDNSQRTQSGLSPRGGLPCRTRRSPSLSPTPVQTHKSFYKINLRPWSKRGVSHIKYTPGVN